MKKQLFKIRLLPVIAFTAVVLLLVKGDMFSMDIGYSPDLPVNSDSRLGDFFCLVKSDACFYISIWAFLTLAYLLISKQKKIKKTKLYIPMAVYLFSVIASFLFSNYKLIALYGTIYRFEGTITICCYIFMLFYTINVVDDKKDAICVIVPTLVTVFIANIVGLTQLIGKDILLSKVTKFLVDDDVSMVGNFDPGQVYQTVYNMNYVGMYLALLIPLLIWVIYKGVLAYKNHTAEEVGLKEKTISVILIFSGLLLFLIALNVYGADSIGGVIGICAGIMTMIISFTDKKKVRIILIVLSVTAFFAGLLIMFFVRKDDRVCVDYFETGRNSLKASIDGNELTIIFDKNTKSYTLFDSDGNPLTVNTYRSNRRRYYVTDERFSGKFIMIPSDNYGVSILCLGLYKDEFRFVMNGDEVKFINPYNKLVSLCKVESCGFKGHLSSGSGRGYIWSRTIPKIREHLLIGSGADTFMMVFPQNDYAGKYSSGTNFDTIVDKPHNMYLQMAVCTGGISCLAFLIMVIMFIVGAIKKGKSNPLLVLIASGVVGFLIAGLFNDSNVCIMPLFYGFMGIGISLSLV